MQKKQIGLVGLGLVGNALATRLHLQGFGVTGYDIRPEASVAFAQHGHRVVESLADLAQVAQTVLLAVFETRDVLEVIESPNGLLSRQNKGEVSCIIDCTTGSPDLLEPLAARLAQRGIDFIEAPLSGASTQIADGEATLLIGGELAAIARAAPLLQAIAKRQFHVGGAGAGAKAKLATNLVLGLNRAALAEGMVFAQALGIEPARFLELVQNSPANSGAAAAKGEMMVALLNGDGVPTQSRIRQHLKDVELMLAAAGASQQALPLSETHAMLMREAVRQGEGDLDNAALIHRLKAARTGPSPE